LKIGCATDGREKRITVEHLFRVAKPVREFVYSATTTVVVGIGN